MDLLLGSINLGVDSLHLLLHLALVGFNLGLDLLLGSFNLGGDNLHVDVDPLDFLLNLAGENLDLGNFSVELAYLRSNMLFD